MRSATTDCFLTKAPVQNAISLVSVIVRSMDRPSLPEALDSISGQSWGNIEIVVVNAKGPEHSPLPTRWGHLPLRLVSTGAPLPRSLAANVGLMEAQGDYLCFLDDDDLFLPDHVESLARALQSADGIHAAYSGVRVEGYEKGQDQLKHQFDFNDAYSLERLRGRNFIPIHAMLFNASLVRDNGCQFDESLELFEDWDFWLQISQHTDVLHLDLISAIYRNCGESGLGQDETEERSYRILKATSRVYDKWRHQWSGADWADIVLFRDILTERAYTQVAKMDAELHRVWEQSTGKVCELERAMAKQVELNTSLSNALQALEYREAALQSAYAKLLSSSSWRVTKPMRLIAQLARGRFRDVSIAIRQKLGIG